MWKRGLTKGRFNKLLSYIDLSYSSLISTEGLSNIHTVILSYCSNLNDVSHLINNYKVDLSGSYRIDSNTMNNLVNTKDLTLCNSILDSLEMLDGIDIVIPKGIIHRVIKGNGPLKIKVFKDLS